MSKFRLDNKTAIITGGGSGIGQAIALNFAENGAKVHILDINLDNAKGTADLINQKGGRAASFGCDCKGSGCSDRIV